MIKKIQTFIFGIYLCFSYSFGNKKKYVVGSQKSKLFILIDMLLWLFREKQFNYNYFAFGLNIKGKKQTEYIGRSEFVKIKEKVEKEFRKWNGEQNIYYEVITKDKFVAHSYLSQNKIPCIALIGLVNRGEIYYSNGENGQIEDLFAFKSPFVLKNTILEAGDGFYLCEQIDGCRLLVNGIESNFLTIKKLLSNGRWIIQKRQSSHKLIQLVNSSALNTTRIVTMINGEEPEFLCGFQSFATGNEKIDSWSKGSIYVGLNLEQSQLKGEGFFHPSFPGKATAQKHPESNIAFNCYYIPFLKESVNLCLKAHKFLYNHFVVGWDVVITDDGPLILEANEKPGMNAVQCLDGGLRLKINDFYRNTLSFKKKNIVKEYSL